MRSPRKRALLFFDEIRVPRSLAKARGNDTLTDTRDRAFDAVIRACAEAPRPGQGGTWITDAMIRAYGELHRRGRAHSVEAWRSGGGSASGGAELVGGIYGVDAGGAFSAESMFYREPNASKLALLHLAAQLVELTGAARQDGLVLLVDPPDQARAVEARARVPAAVLVRHADLGLGLPQHHLGGHRLDVVTPELPAAAAAAQPEQREQGGGEAQG